MIRQLLAATAILVASSNYVVAQTVNRDDILYILPQWTAFITADDTTVSQQIAALEGRIGPGGAYVKLGFTVYISISMTDWNVDISNPTAVRAALTSTISEINAVVAKARRFNIPLSLAMLTAIRETYDPVQSASEAEDVRSMQWYADNKIAAGWWSHSRYARKQFAVQEAYIREVGKVIANLMSLYPDTLVAASGDGEVELAIARANNIYADYSPFAVAEFRDWIRHAGLYADGARFSGQGYSLGSRYAGDRTPGEDTNGDGHTLNGDFATTTLQPFQTWDLLHFDWSLDDSYTPADPHAIALTAYSSPGYVVLPGQVAGGFDAPRLPQAIGADPWWDLWVLFKVTMLQRHNQEFAKWMTTSIDPATGTTVPTTQWYSYQIPADYIFNGSPANPNDRWYSSASSWWTADVSPYGSLGITAFNVDFRERCQFVEDDLAGCYVAKTLANVAPVIAARDLRWGVIEWHPGHLASGLGVSPASDIYQAEITVVKQYRPSLLVPFEWNDPSSNVLDTPFEPALKQLVADLKDGTASDPRLTIDIATGTTITPPFVLSGTAIDLGKIRGPGRGTGIDRVEVIAYPKATGQPPIVLGAAAYGVIRPEVGAAYGAQFTPSGFTITMTGLQLQPGAYDLVVSARSTVTQTVNVTQTISVVVAYPGSATPAALRFGATKAGAASGLVSTTPPQVVTGVYSGPGVPAWIATVDQPWLAVTAGPSVGQFTVGISDPQNVIGASPSLGATLTLTAANLGLTVAVPIILTVEVTGTSTLPFGSFDTPLDGATALSGSIAVTGWALDDVGVDRVEIWRDLLPGETTMPYTGPGLGHGKVFIANPLFINGARPDVEHAYPAIPQSYRAGWGYLMLTQGLANQGNGVYTLYAFAYDTEGHGVALGTKTITVDNANAVKPFGGIDTPDLGATVSGGFWNFGWALTPNPNSADMRACVIGTGGVQVSIDSGPLMNVSYGDRRDDIAAAFPGFSNGTGAGGAYYIDTTALPNGTHQIAWLVTDSCGRADGIGSRFFTVLNVGGAPTVAAARASGDAPTAPAAPAAVAN